MKILRKQILISPYLSFFMHRNSVLFLLHKAYSRFSLTKSILYEKRLLFPHFLYGCLLVTLKVGALEIIVTGDLHSRKSACNFRIFFFKYSLEDQKNKRAMMALYRSTG